MRQIDQKIVMVTRETRLAGLKKRFATKSQAKFYVGRAIETELLADIKAGAAAPLTHVQLRDTVDKEFHEYEEEQQLYDDALARVRTDCEILGPKVQIVERNFLPNFVFGPHDIVVTIGQDGLVANVAKYALKLPLVAVNPDPKRIDGVLLPFGVEDARNAVRRVLDGAARIRPVTMAEALLPAGQRLLAFNDLFIGAQSHVSARYRIRFGQQHEPQSSSGVIVSTGAGSTGWLSSVFNMSAGLAKLNRGIGSTPVRMKWEDPRLMFVVREPFISKHSGASIVAGMIEPRQELVIESLMGSGGVIFSDGVEADYLPFNSGTVARIRAAAEHARLVTS